jgi:hypothetical protein
MVTGYDGLRISGARLTAGALDRLCRLQRPEHSPKRTYELLNVISTPGSAPS